MTASEHVIPETHVLAIASHVVSGYVGNKIAVFVLQSLGCDVSALNTVQFSNHTGYGQWTGTRTTAEEITSLFEGLKNSEIADFDMMLSGYTPGAAAVEAVGKIALELSAKTLREKGPGRFFWVLDPVMGDNGSLYVAPDVVPAYRKLLGHADLILPNQFEAEYEMERSILAPAIETRAANCEAWLPGPRILSETKIRDHHSLTAAIQTLHTRYRIPHIVITSVSLRHPDHAASTLSVVGSTMTSTWEARPFKITFPAIDAYFSGTGDMFAALILVRMREAAFCEGETLVNTPSWQSPDDVDALDLPLAKAAERVLGSMHEVLTRTSEAMINDLARWGVVKSPGETEHKTNGVVVNTDEKTLHLRMSKAAELKLVRNMGCLRDPRTQFKAQSM